MIIDQEKGVILFFRDEDWRIFSLKITRSKDEVAEFTSKIWNNVFVVQRFGWQRWVQLGRLHQGDVFRWRWLSWFVQCQKFQQHSHSQLYWEVIASYVHFTVLNHCAILLSSCHHLSWVDICQSSCHPLWHICFRTVLPSLPVSSEYWALHDA